MNWTPWRKVARANPAWPIILQEIGSWDEQRQQPPFEQDFGEYLKAVKLMPVFMACIGKITSAATDVPWVYCNSRTDDPIEPQASKLAQIFDGYTPGKPNPLSGPRTLRYEAFQQRAMFGELYLYLDGPSPVKINEAMVMRSASCGPILSRDQSKQIMAFEYGTTGARQVLPREQMVFSRRPHPADPVRGLSPIAELEQTFRALAPFYGLQASTMKNGARMGGILVLKGAVRMTAEERKALGADFDRKYGGDNAGKTSVLQAEDADWKQTAMTSRDAEFSALYEIMRREIFNVLQVPPGLFDSKDVNRSNMREQRALLYTDAVRPMVDAILEDINRHPWALAAGEYVKADWDQVEALQKDQAEESTAIVSLVGARVLTRNEARARLGLDEVEGGDEFDAPPSPFGLSNANGNGNGRKPPVPADAEVPA